MATGAEHYRRAEKLLAAVDKGVVYDDGTPIVYDEPNIVAAAQVHATLALAAATALSDPGTMRAADAEAWEAAASTRTDGNAP